MSGRAVQWYGMQMVRLILAVLALAGFLLGGRSTHAQSAAVQSLFLGDRTCADTETACVYPHVVPQHRYLHIVIHDEPNTYAWRVQAGASCDALTTIAGGDAIDENGYLEKVVDLMSLSAAPFPTPLCLVLRGDEGFTNTYYTAYLDDTPSPDADTVYPGYELLLGRPPFPDIDVTYIRRLPALAYDASPNIPRTGQTVSWEAHIVNAGTSDAHPFDFHWVLDGTTVRTGSFDRSLAPGESATLTMPWRWDERPHELELVTEPVGPEIASGNDRLSIRTNALTLGFWVERSAYDFFRAHQWTYCENDGCGDSDSFEDWVQRQLRSWNDVLATPNYPDLAPAGIADRVRLDEIVIVPDGALPLHGYRPTNSPDTTDHSVDLEWGMPATAIGGYKLDHDGPFNLEWSLIHELGHARSLIDLYRFDVPAGGDDRIDVTAADGGPAFNSSNPLDTTRPLKGFPGTRREVLLYRNHENDLMSCDCNHFYSAYDTLALNRIRNRRAACGNYNPPCNMGEWVGEMPPENRLRVLDAQGAPVPDGSEIRLFSDTGQTYNGHAFDDAHSTHLQTIDGLVTLPHNPFAADSKDAAGHNLLLVEARVGDADTFCFAEPTDFTMAYWLGYRTGARPATYTLQLGSQIGNGCNLELPPAIINEPFATSPYASLVRIGSPRKTAHGSVRDVRIRLVDDALPHNRMRNRLVVVQNGHGRTLGSGKTSASGTTSISVRGSSGSLRVVDVTDNDLLITGRPADPPPAAAPRR